VKSRRGFLLIMVLFISAILLTLGLGYLSGTMRNYQSAFSAVAGLQARALARAGLEDALQKLNKDRDFPPLPSSTSSTLGQVAEPFSYSEDFLDVDNVTPLGYYQVQVDTRFQSGPYQWEINPNQLIQITSTGYAGRTRSSTTAQASMRLTLDVHNPDQIVVGPDIARIVQDPFPSSNPRLFHQVRFEDLSGL
jgi:hypothetical protein